MQVSNWVIGIPVWGQRYRDVFVTCAWPALVVAINRLGVGVKVIIHTDDAQDLFSRMLPCALAALDFYKVPAESKYVALQQSHGDAINKATLGDKVVLLNADIVVSGNLLTRCEEHFNAGKQAVVLIGIRTLQGEAPPVGAEPRALLEWAWRHRHQIIRDLEWGTGCSVLPTNLFFVASKGVVCRAFHQHPVALLKTKEFRFISTIDGDLLDHVPQGTIHVVTSPDDLSMLEISPAEKAFGVNRSPIATTFVAHAMLSRASPLHRWLFQQRIVVTGELEGDYDSKVAHGVLTEMNRLDAQQRHSPGRRGFVRGRHR